MNALLEYDNYYNMRVHRSSSVIILNLDRCYQHHGASLRIYGDIVCLHREPLTHN